MSNFDEIRKIMIEAGRDFLDSLEEELSEDNCECEEECCCDIEDDIVDPLVYFNQNWVPPSLKEKSYHPNDFIHLIFDIGSGFYSSYSLDGLDSSTPILDSVRKRLLEDISCHYVIVREQKGRIAIAVPIYIKDIVNKVAKSLGVIPEIFIEVSGPQSTVLIIDCEKEWLRSKYLGIGEEEWLL